MGDFKEEELYSPIKKFFESKGYVVRGEVKGCDIALVKGEELTIVELKKSFNISLLYQALDRQKITNTIYIAIPRKIFMLKRGHILHVLEKLGIGLITVAMDSNTQLVEAQLLPAMAKSRYNKRTKALLAEFNGRTFDGNLGGVTGRKLLTAHRERNLHIACALEKAGEAKSSELIKKYNCIDHSWRLLNANYYNWFMKIEKGIYSLSEDGKNALTDPNYAEVVAYYRKAVEECITAEKQEL
ncbi:MAG: DUF2161 family putative PD-(D/E)XK-type phosphodiesterase [Defluviitaleaceae bacterium]|nr:DUF2161 family putative PD-(D/E)XK-type phosphodiesterase [Defluviitaleaceae bacterium]